VFLVVAVVEFVFVCVSHVLVLVGLAGVYGGGACHCVLVIDEQAVVHGGAGTHPGVLVLAVQAGVRGGGCAGAHHALGSVERLSI
jgi:hypothetical protein